MENSFFGPDRMDVLARLRASGNVRPHVVLLYVFITKMVCWPSQTHDRDDANLDLAASIRCQTAGRARSPPHEGREHVIIPETLAALSTGCWSNVTERPRRPAHFAFPFPHFSLAVPRSRAAIAARTSRKSVENVFAA
jgi:hypothetical protein